MRPLNDLAKVGTKQHYPSLDGLRGLAILLVFFFHYGDTSNSSLHFLRVANEFKKSGWIGVDIFFVLSGFLITGILFESRNDASYYKRFYVRRALRLFPIFYLVALVVLLFAPVLQVHWQWGYLAFLLYGANIVMAIFPNLEQVGLVTVMHLWTLAVEEQFYMLWPFAVRHIKSRERILQFALAVIAIAFAIRVVAFYSGISTHVLYMELPTRMDSLAVGAVLALLLRGPRPDLWMHIARISLVPLWLLVVSMAAYEGGLHFLSPLTALIGYSLLAFASGALVSETLRPGSWAERAFSNSIMRFIGKISYGMYIYHLLPWRAAKPVYAYLFLRFHSQLMAGLSTLGVFLTGTILVSWLSYKFFEMPFLRLKDKLAPAAGKKAALVE